MKSIIAVLFSLLSIQSFAQQTTPTIEEYSLEVLPAVKTSDRTSKNGHHIAGKVLRPAINATFMTSTSVRALFSQRCEAYDQILTELKKVEDNVYQTLVKDEAIRKIKAEVRAELLKELAPLLKQ